MRGFLSYLAGMRAGMRDTILSGEELPMKYAGFVALLCVFPILAIAVWQETIPPVARETAYGCYSASNGPPIRISEAGMQVQQEGFPLLGFEIERTKLGIAIVADRPAYAVARRPLNEFRIAKYDGGFLWAYFKTMNGNRYAEHDEKYLKSFKIALRQGADICFMVEWTPSCAKVGTVLNLN